MADGRHFENRYIVISQWKIIRFRWNFVHSSRFWTGCTSRDKKWKSCIGQTPSSTEHISCSVCYVSRNQQTQQSSSSSILIRKKTDSNAETFLKDIRGRTEDHISLVIYLWKIVITFRCATTKKPQRCAGCDCWMCTLKSEATKAWQGPH